MAWAFSLLTCLQIGKTAKFLLKTLNATLGNADSSSFWFRTQNNLYLYHIFHSFESWRKILSFPSYESEWSANIRTLESLMLFFLQRQSLHSKSSGPSQILPSRVLGFQKLTKITRPWILFLPTFHKRSISQWIKPNLAWGRFVPRFSHIFQKRWLCGFLQTSYWLGWVRGE